MSDPDQQTPEPAETAGPMESRKLDQRLDPRVVDAWRLSGLLSLSVQGGMGLVVAIIVTLSTRLGAPRVLGIWLLAVLVLATWSLVVPALSFARWRYRLVDRQLELRRGVIFHSTTRVPLSRIQHIDLSRGPVERIFGLASLLIHTAGTHAAVVLLPGLTAERAQQLRDQLIDVGAGDAV